MNTCTHMPFLTTGLDGHRVLFYCRASVPPPNRGRVWKLWAAGVDGDRRLETGFGAEVVECSPAGWEDDAGWHVSFIAGGAKEHPLFRLWAMHGPSLDKLGRPRIIHAPTRTGFLLRDRIVHAEPERYIHIRRSAGLLTLEMPDVMILRVIYRADAEEKLLVSVQRPKEKEPFTIEYNLLNGRQEIVECDGLPAYKCAILNDETLYTQRIGDDFENRRIVRGTIVTRRPMDGRGFRKVRMDHRDGESYPAGCQPVSPITRRAASALIAP